MGSGILFAYPQLATIAGVQGVVIYAFASAAPLLIFAVLGPIIRRKAPEGFVLTEWTRQRYGLVAALFLSLMTMITMCVFSAFTFLILCCWMIFNILMSGSCTWWPNSLLFNRLSAR